MSCQTHGHSAHITGGPRIAMATSAARPRLKTIAGAAGAGMSGRSRVRARRAQSWSATKCAVQAMGKNHELCLVSSARPKQIPASTGKSTPPSRSARQ